MVTELEFRLHEVGPVVQFGLLFWDAARGGEALRLIRDVIADLPWSLNAETAAIIAPPERFVPPEHQHKPGYALLLVGFGNEAEHRQVLDRLRNGLPPLFESVSPMPYVALQQMLDVAKCLGILRLREGRLLRRPER